MTEGAPSVYCGECLETLNFSKTDDVIAENLRLIRDEIRKIFKRTHRRRHRKAGNDMKLGEALTLRARQAQRLNELQDRIKMAVLVQEGDTPQENANELIAAYLEESSKHEELVSAIARTNATTTLDDGTTLLVALQRRETLIRERNIYRLAATAANPAKNNMMYRYSRSEIKFVPTVDVQELRGKEETLEKKISQIDARIQKINWETELE